MTRFPLLFLILLVAACTGTPSTEPGSRSASGAWFGLGSMTDRILDLQEKIADTQKALAEALRDTDDEYGEEIKELEAKRRDAPRLGLPVITDSKSDYTEEIEKLRRAQAAEKAEERERYTEKETALEREIKAALATPPSRSARERMESIRANTASREAQEVYSGMVNLRESILELNEKLREESTNYDLAATTYRAQLKLYETVIEMNREFRERIENVYRPGMKAIERRIAPAIENTRASALPENRKSREITKLERIRTALQAAYPKLDAHKAWAAENISELETLEGMHRTLLGNVEIAGDAAAMIAEVNAEIASLDFEPPPLIEYDLEAGDFELDDPPAREP